MVLKLRTKVRLNRVRNYTSVGQLGQQLYRLPQIGCIKNYKLTIPKNSFSSTSLGYKAKELTDLNSTVSNEEYKVDPSIKKVLVLGSGGLTIGQAGEFDYSGSQAIKALKESNISVTLINPNIATIQTSKGLADKVYFTPITPYFVTKVIEKEKPDGILLTFGGQTALNCGVELDKLGVFEKYNVQVLGTPIQTLICSEDRELFVKALNEINIPVAQSTACNTVKEAIDAANQIGYPLIIRSAYSLGGLGSGFVNDESELIELASKSLTLTTQILVEKSMKGWKEVEYEVVRDKDDNCITVCNMENFDPLGIHTGDSIVVAPSQTLNDKEYHMLRTAAIQIVRHVGVVGECNVQYALNPESNEYKVIEMNARLSRSSALASKATGYPLAFVAAKLALGFPLTKLNNKVTKDTTACFEPSLDYIVTKIPRWDLNKFLNVDNAIGSSMMSVGEVMAVGRTFQESLQKATRMADPSFKGFQPLNSSKIRSLSDKDIDNLLVKPTDRRLFHLSEAMINRNYPISKLHNLTKIDNWFLYKLDTIYKARLELLKVKNLNDLHYDQILELKKLGYSDYQIATILSHSDSSVTELSVRNLRTSLNIRPYVKRIDTLAGEYPTTTNYLYTTYHGTNNDLESDPGSIMVLGSGVYRIGSSVEFDWCAVNLIRSLRKLNKRVVVVNYNPETVSTDFDEADRLYFEELSLERVLDIYQFEKCQGVVVSVGGQLPQNIALQLQQSNVNVLGTDPKDIDNAENRSEFSNILDSLNIDQPSWKKLQDVNEATTFANQVGYPVLVRPSYVLSGAAMNVAKSDSELKGYLALATDVSPDYPVVITKFLEGCQELDFDGVAHNGNLLCHAVSLHVEKAGVHSGDATLILPPTELPESTLNNVKEISVKLAKQFKITGPFNMQIIRQITADGTEKLKVIELNLRASRSFPFVSKTLNFNFIHQAALALITPHSQKLESVDLMAKKYNHVGVKVSQFSWTRLQGADPTLSVEMASTGEVAALSDNPFKAYLLALMGTLNFKLPKNTVLLNSSDIQPALDNLVEAATYLNQVGLQLVTNVPLYYDTLKSKQIDVQFIEVDAKINDWLGLKTSIRQNFNDNKVDMVLDFSTKKSNIDTKLPFKLNTETLGYLTRRSAVDIGIPILNDPNLNLYFAKALTLAYKDKKIDLDDQIKDWETIVEN